MTPVVDSSSITAWFEAYSASLVLYARHWLARDEAEDVVHDVFAQMMLVSPPPREPRAWLFRAVRNASISRTRSFFRRRKREADSRPPAIFESRIDDLMDARIAEAALSQLAPAQREIVVLRIWCGCGFEEIGLLVGGATSSVYQQYKESLAQMRTRLESPCRTKTT